MVPTPRPEDKSRRTEITSTIVTEALTRASLAKDSKDLYDYYDTNPTDRFKSRTCNHRYRHSLQVAI
jgi:hypothetical protein